MWPLLPKHKTNPTEHKVWGCWFEILKRSRTGSIRFFFFSSKPLAQSFLRSPIMNPHLDSCFASLNSKLLMEDFTEPSLEVSHQKDLSHKIDKSNSFQLSSECNLIDKARILYCSAPHASAWIRALPTSSNKFTNFE